MIPFNQLSATQAGILFLFCKVYLLKEIAGDDRRAVF